MVDINKLYTIDEVSRIINESKSTLRFWEQNFPSLIPIRDSKGRRKYSDDNIKELLKIKKLLKVKGYTVQGAKNILETSRNSEILKVIGELKMIKEMLLNHLMV